MVRGMVSLTAYTKNFEISPTLCPQVDGFMRELAEAILNENCCDRLDCQMPRSMFIFW